MITVTLRQILQARNALQSLAVAKLPFKAALACSRLVTAVNEELAVFDEKRKELLAANEGKVDESIRQQIDEAMELEVELPVNKIDVDMIADLEFQVGDITAMEPFLEGI